VGRLRSLLFSDVDEVFERPIARYVRFALEHRWLLAIMSFAEIALNVVLWRRSGLALGDTAVFVVIGVIVFAMVLVPYAGVRAAVRRLRDARREKS
jgi:uncharacterized membrane protein YhaH (DUF805 family)